MIGRFLATLALGALLAAPAAASPVPGNLHYDTALFQMYGSTIPSTGALDLQVAADGTVRGYYNPAGLRSFVPVNGGIDGKRVWFDIGGAGDAILHVSGTIEANGKIAGQAWQSGLARSENSPLSYGLDRSNGFRSSGLDDSYAFTAAPRS